MPIHLVLLTRWLDAAVDLVRISTRGAEDRPAAGQDPRDLARPERHEDALDEPAPALAHAERVPPARERPAADRADDRVQPRAVPAAGEDPDPHRNVILWSGGDAEGGNRTHTARRPPDFESGASTSSATSASAIVAPAR